MAKKLNTADYLRELIRKRNETEGRMEDYKGILRQYVRGYYDLQKLRIQTGNRIVMNFMVRLGIEPGKKIDTSDPVAKKILDFATKDFERITDVIVEKDYGDNVKVSQVAKIVEMNNGIIDDAADYYLIETYRSHLNREKTIIASLKSYLKRFAIYNEFLGDVNGCGTLMSAVVISEIDIRVAQYVSSIWKYAGLDVVGVIDDENNPVMEGRSCKESHYERIEYIDKDGKETSRMGVKHNRFLKSKLMGVLAAGFLKAYPLAKIKEGHYAQIYYDTVNRERQKRNLRIIHLKKVKKMKHEDAEKQAFKEVNDKRIEFRSKRKMIKMFLQNLYIEWKRVENLPAVEPYAQRILKMPAHNQHDKQ